MAINPMQRKVRNSFLLGMVITLLVTGVIIALLFMQVKNYKDAQKAENAKLVKVYALNQEVKSGQVLTQDMFSIKTVNRETVPNNATSLASVIDTWFLQTKDGENVYTDDIGLYLAKEDQIIEVFTEGGNYYKTVNGEKQQVKSADVKTDEEGSFVVDKTEDILTRVYISPTGDYYKYKLVENRLTATGSETTREKVYLELTNVPVVAKVDMKANTVITPNLVEKSDAITTDDVRTEEYNMVVLPMDLLTDDYVDIRLMLPSGQNFIVLSKKQVTVPQLDDGTIVADTIIMNLREDEILTMSSAIVDAYKVKGAKLYANKYSEPGMQNAAEITYIPNEETTALISRDPNIIEQAKQELAARYNDDLKYLRNDYINNIINSELNAKENVTTGMDESITNTQSTRKKYLDSLQGY